MKFRKLLSIAMLLALLIPMVSACSGTEKAPEAVELIVAADKTTE